VEDSFSENFGLLEVRYQLAEVAAMERFNRLIFWKHL
jgi:hypothetical protein